MKLTYCLGADPLLKTCKVGATVVAGGPVIRDTNKYGEVIQCTTTASADSLGLALNAATYATSAEGTCVVACNPFQVIRAKCTGGATEGTALPSLAQTSASTTVFTAAVGTADMTGGYLFALSGANAGLKRVATSTSSNASVTVTVAFPNSIAVGDYCVWVPYSIGSHTVQTTAAFTEANATIASGTGIHASVLECELELPISTSAPNIYVDFVLVDSIWNPID